MESFDQLSYTAFLVVIKLNIMILSIISDEKGLQVDCTPELLLISFDLGIERSREAAQIVLLIFEKL